MKDECVNSWSQEINTLSVSNVTENDENIPDNRKMCTFEYCIFSMYK